MSALLNARTIRHVPALVCLLVGIGCKSVEVTPPADPDRLITGELLFGEVVAPAPRIDMLALTPEMKRYAREKTAGANHSRKRLTDLLEGMIDDGLLDLEYEPNLTHTARETFETREGNCLSFSILFVALAREAGLDVRFQIVDVPPMFTAKGELVALNDHINVLVRRVREGTLWTRDHVVDFNIADYSGNYRTTRVTDKYTSALYHSNLAIDALQHGDVRGAFAQIKRAIEYRPEIADLWVNLGVIYAGERHYDLAIDAYNQALSIEGSNRSALVNLAVAYTQTGNVELAAQYSDLVDYYVDKNPYYHFFKARQAYDAEDYETSLAEVNEAISLNDSDHRFFLLRGLSYYALDDKQRATKNLEQARSLVQHGPTSERYSRKIAVLKGNQG